MKTKNIFLAMIVALMSTVICPAQEGESTKEGIAEIIDKARRSVPSLNTSQAITLFSGLRPTPNTGDFIIKQSDACKRMFLADITSKDSHRAYAETKRKK